MVMKVVVNAPLFRMSSSVVSLGLKRTRAVPCSSETSALMTPGSFSNRLLILSAHLSHVMPVILSVVFFMLDKSPQGLLYSTQQLIFEMSLTKDWAASLTPSDRVGKMWVVLRMSSNVRPCLMA